MGCLFLLVIVIGLPMAEIEVFRLVSARIGGWDTFFLVIFSAVFGSYLAKHQGIAVLTKIQQCLSQGIPPTFEMIDGVLIFLGGILFIFPGFVSDGLGLLLIFPLTRWAIRWVILGNLKVTPSRAQTTNKEHPKHQDAPKQRINRSGVVDAEVIE